MFQSRSIFKYLVAGSVALLLFDRLRWHGCVCLAAGWPDDLGASRAMIDWLFRILVGVITVVVATLTITSLPTLADQHMEGQRLMIHMMAGGTLVFAVPVFALLFLRACDLTPPFRRATAIWFLAADCGVADCDHQRAAVHAAAAVDRTDASMDDAARLRWIRNRSRIAVAGDWGVRWRRMQATRSATPG